MPSRDPQALYATTRLANSKHQEVSQPPRTAQHNAKMSDYEDDMDVDAPAPQDEVIFSADQSKGKRSAANLPVEAEDTLPWYEHARPPLRLLTFSGLRNTARTL
jgi:hypothetical protein